MDDLRKTQEINDLKKWIDERHKDRYSSYEYFDKLVVTISSGGLFLSIGFVSDVIEITPDTNTLFLKMSWIILTGSLFSSLVSYFIAAKANENEVDCSNEELSFLKGEINEYSNYYLKKMRVKKMLNKTINVLNFSSLFLLIFGVLSFILFINQNL